MGRRLDDWSPVSVDLAGIPRRRISDEDRAVLVRAAQESLQKARTYDAVWNALIRLGTIAAKSAAKAAAGGV